jgi:hypothetical protein
MACFNAWDIGACGCAPTGCTGSGAACACNASCSPFPNTLYLTDFNGTWPCTFTSPRWSSAALTAAVSAVCVFTGSAYNCNAGSVAGTTCYSYTLQCIADGQIKITRTLSYLASCTSGFACGSGFVQFYPMPGCSVPGLDPISTVTTTLVPCSTYAWSGNLVCASGCDPFSLAISISR